MTTLGEIMSKSVVTTDSESSLIKTAKKMAEMRVGSLVVVDKGKICGIVTERDMFRKVIAEEKDYRKLKVRDVMTSPVVTVKPDTSLTEASKILESHGFRRLPVVEDGKLVGIVTETDLWLRMTEETVDNLKKSIFSGDIPDVVEEYVNKVTELNQQIRAGRQKLAESEERYRTIFESANDGIVIVSKDGVLEDINETASRVLGYRPEEFKGLSLKELTRTLPPKSLATVLEKFGLQMLGKEIKPFEVEMIHADGRTVNLEINAVPLRKDGKITGDLAILRDVTERKQAEERLNHLNVVLRTIRNINQLISKEGDRRRLIQGACENLVDICSYLGAWIVLTDESRRVVEAAESGLGSGFHDIEERLRRGEMTVCGERVLEQQDVLVVKDVRTTCASCPLSRVHEDMKVGAFSSRLEDKGRIYGILTVYITEDLLADAEEKNLFKEIVGDIAFALQNLEQEEALERSRRGIKESQELYQSIINNMNDIVVTTDGEDKITSLNTAGQELLGYDHKSVLGNPVTSIFAKAEELERAMKVLEKEKRLEDFEINLITKDKEEIICLLTIAELGKLDNTVIGKVYVLHDIRARKRREEELQKRVNELERFQKVTVDRELRMVELKKRIKDVEANAKEKTTEG
jgi:PAS domain S-box-containing protein